MSFIYERKSRNLSRVYVDLFFIRRNIRNGRRSIFILSQRKENTVELLSIYVRKLVFTAGYLLYLSTRKESNENNF
jgi:hypothetical protein